MALSTYPKTPAETLDYGFDWSTWLASGDTIAASSWTVPAGLSAGAASFSTTSAAQYLSGGAIGQDYVVTNTVTTAAGRIGARSSLIQVRATRGADGNP